MRRLWIEPVRWLLASLALVVGGLAIVLSTPSAEASTPGTVSGFGFRLDGSRCHLNVTYTVDGTKHRIKTDEQKRWCAYQPNHDDADASPTPVVFYDASAPERATLSPRGRLPTVAIALGSVGALVCAARIAKREPQRNEPVGPATVSR